MATKKNYRADNTYIISSDSTDNPKLGAKVLSDGRESLFLDFYLGFEMAVSAKSGKEYKKVNNAREFLKLYLWQSPRTPIERQQNKETLELAKRIRHERGQELLENASGYRLKKDRNVNFLEYFQTYIDNYTKKDIGIIKSAFNRFKDFLKDTPEYSKYSTSLRPEHLNKDMITAFTEYLQSRSIGEGAKSIYGRFKKVINYAVERDIITKSPCVGVTIKTDLQILRKDVLSSEEIQRLTSTHYQGRNPMIRNAFIFCLYTGMRFCDVKDLTFANIDYSNRLLKFEQNKTKGHSANSGVVIPLNDGLLSLVGEVPASGVDTPVFCLPGYITCLYSLSEWVKRAGITKHITWHCARHSFAVNILNNGANIKTVASLLGHSGLTQTEKYTRAVDSLKQDAINSLPELKL